MSQSVFRDEKIIVSFDRIGPHTKVPELVVPAMPIAYLRECIRTYATWRLGGEPLQVHFTGDGGVLATGTDQSGSFTLNRRPRQ